jgi:hypothetical protein
MIEAVMIWNEPNNKSHWDLELDPEWLAFSRMSNLAGQAIAAEKSDMVRVLGGISPIDPLFIDRLARQGGLDELDVVAVHGFPLDWNHWQIQEWPAKLEEIRAVTSMPIWVSEVGASTFGAEEIQVFGLQRTAELLINRTPRIHWYSLYDLPKAWPATTRHREAEGSSYYRHYYMGLHRHQLGRLFPPECHGLVRSANGGARRLCGNGHLLFHAGTPRPCPALHKPADRERRIRGVLRGHGTALRWRRRVAKAVALVPCRSPLKASPGRSRVPTVRR